LSAAKNGLVLPPMRNCASSVGSALPELPEFINELAADGRNRDRGSPDPHLRVTESLRHVRVSKGSYDRTK
jgi:hypothetical protein